MIAVDNLDAKLAQMSKKEMDELYLLLQAEDKINCEESYYHFFKQAWKVLEPQTPLDDNWHIKYICGLLQVEVDRIIRGEKRVINTDLIINIPPRSGKSYLVTVMLTPWIWSRYPHIKVINSSFNGDLSTKLCLDSRRLIESEWYRNYWGDVFHLTTDMNTKSWYENNKRGMRKSTSTTGTITGTGADILIVDDAQDPIKAESELERETVQRHYGKTLYSRLNNQEVGLRVIIQQRLHEEDLTGYLLANDSDKYRHICIPATETEDINPPELRKHYKDGLFCPARFPYTVLENSKSPTNLGSYGYAGQMLQKPSPPEGGTFKRHWWRFWVPAGTENIPVITFKDETGKIKYSEVVELPEKFQQVIDSWDFALDGKIESDDVCGSKWGKQNADKYLLDAIVDKLDYPASKEAFKKLYYSNTATSAELIERAANGPAIKADLKHEIPGIIDIPVGKLSKEDKVHYSDTVPYAAQACAGNIILPHPALFPWVNEWIEEHAIFPKGAQDGRVDSGRQAVNYLTTAKYVWNSYSASNTYDLNIKWEETQYRKTLHYGSIVQLKDLSIWFLEALWDDVAGKLYLYGCWTQPQPNPTLQVPYIIYRMKMKRYQTENILSNAIMWVTGETKGYVKSVGKLFRAMFSEKLPEISIGFREAHKYDELGAITEGNRMFSQNVIFVSNEAKPAARQFSSWVVEKGQPDEQNGYCTALCQIISELRRRKLLKEEKPQRDYKYMKKRGIQDKINKVLTEY